MFKDPMRISSYTILSKTKFQQVTCCALLVTVLHVFAISICSASDIKVVLTGNTTDLKNSSSLFEVMEKYCSNEPSPVLWVLNGDIFSSTANEEQIGQWQAKAVTLLDRFPQLEILITQGDRDWDDSGKDGWEKIQ